jgi:hypothetical protein
MSVAYLDAVFKVLNHINGDAARVLVDEGRLTPAVTSRLRAIYSDPLYAVEVRIAQQGIAARFDNVRRPPGDRVTVVDRLLTASRTCVFVETHSDLSTVEVTPNDKAVSEYWELSPKRTRDDPQGFNPTPWQLTFNADYLTRTNMASTCVA